MISCNLTFVFELAFLFLQINCFTSLTHWHETCSRKRKRLAATELSSEYKVFLIQFVVFNNLFWRKKAILLCFLSNLTEKRTTWQNTGFLRRSNGKGTDESLAVSKFLVVVWIYILVSFVPSLWLFQNQTKLSFRHGISSWDCGISQNISSRAYIFHGAWITARKIVSLHYSCFIIAPLSKKAPDVWRVSSARMHSLDKLWALKQKRDSTRRFNIFLKRSLRWFVPLSARMISG